jgi:hypothetical protein
MNEQSEQAGAETDGAGHEPPSDETAKLVDHEAGRRLAALAEEAWDRAIVSTLIGWEHW